MKNKKIVFFLFTCLICSLTFAQDLSYSKPGKKFYREMDNPLMPDSEEWAKISDSVNVNFISENQGLIHNFLKQTI